ncbi:MAG: DUF2304 domain-containing protein [Planctomycetes bacterium]|nr:DUF2304 domain-containing protein [Planctomycetota bacterium]
MIAVLLLPLADLEPMHDRQRIVAIAGSIAVALIVFELVRRRKLREEYAWVWLATAAAVCLLALDQALLLTITGWLGAASSASTLFFGAIVFLMALCVQFSIRLSRLTHRQRTLAQRLALLEEEVGELRRQRRPQAARDEAPPSGKDEVA